MDFQEHSPIEQGFSVAFRTDLLPLLQQKERERLLQVTRLKQICWLIFGTCLLAAGLLWVVTAPGDFFRGMVIILATAAVFGPLAYWRILSDKWSLSIAELILPVIAEHLGTFSYQDRPPHSFPLRAMETLGVVPDHDKAELSHWIKGSYRNTDFELVQANLISKGKQNAAATRRQNDVFNGLLLHIATLHQAPGHILITKDLGNLGRGIGKLWSHITQNPMQHVDIGNPDFANAFDIYASDPTGAGDFLPNETLDHLLAIANSQDRHFGPQLLTAGFEDRSFYLALRREEKFLQMPSITQSLIESDELIHAAFAEIEAIYQIIDQLHGHQSPDFNVKKET